MKDFKDAITLHSDIEITHLYIHLLAHFLDLQN